MGFLKFLLIFLVVVWFVGLILRATFSRFLKRTAENYNRAAEAATKEAQRQARDARRKVGEVTVEQGAATGAKKVNRTVGEYVEFEEVE